MYINPAIKDLKNKAYTLFEFRKLVHWVTTAFVGFCQLMKLKYSLLIKKRQLKSLEYVYISVTIFYVLGEKEKDFIVYS